MRKYIQSFRLRTLPLSISGIILGTAIAYPKIDVWVFILAILTTLSLQILSNLANELGDARHGTDEQQEGRVAYGLQAGAFSEQQMVRCIVVFSFLSAIFGVLLIYSSFGTLFALYPLIFLLLGLLAIIAALKYTLGKKPYGYQGFGDLSVFIFFGLVSTLGAFFLQTQTLTWQATWLAVAIGLPIVAVLNLNNIRDMENDVKYGKRTLASKLGSRNAKVYHTIILLIPFLIFVLLKSYIPIILLPVFMIHIWIVWHISGKRLDKQMPLLSFSTLGLALMAAVTFLI